MRLFVYKLVRTLGLPIYKLLYKPTIIGRENIPSKGGVILAGNHINNLDAATMVGVPNRVVHILAKKELFDTKNGNRFYRSMGCIRVDRTSHEDNVKTEVDEVLKSGEVIGLFPEGTTNKTNEIILPFKYGAVSFAKKNNIPIVPFAITGKYVKFKKGLTIEFGKPIYITKDLDEENERLMNIIKNMILKRRDNEESKIK